LRELDTDKKVRAALLEVELKHYDFFKQNHKSIVDYISIYWGKPVYIKIKDSRLPIEISMDLDEYFNWMD
jgi:hypothetical protein